MCLPRFSSPRPELFFADGFAFCVVEQPTSHPLNSTIEVSSRARTMRCTRTRLFRAFGGCIFHRVSARGFSRRVCELCGRPFLPRRRDERVKIKPELIRDATAHSLPLLSAMRKESVASVVLSGLLVFPAQPGRTLRCTTNCGPLRFDGFVFIHRFSVLRLLVRIRQVLPPFHRDAVKCVAVAVPAARASMIPHQHRLVLHHADYSQRKAWRSIAGTPRRKVCDSDFVHLGFWFERLSAAI